MKNRRSNQIPPVRPQAHTHANTHANTHGYGSYADETPASLLILKSILALAAILAACLFVSFLFVEFQFEYRTAHVPAASAVLDENEPSGYLLESDIPKPKEAALPVYDFTKPVPESSAEAISYFNDTVFIGDSRTAGLILYTKMSPIDFSAVGSNVKTIMQTSYVRIPGEDGTPKNYKLLEALALKKGEFKSVYIAMGLNELGWDARRFVEYYKIMIDEIRTVTDVPIYIQLIMPVTVEAAETSQFGITNEKAQLFNDEIRKIAAEMELLLLDPTHLLTLEDGTLDPSVTYDGIHLNPGAYSAVVDYYCSHVVDVTRYANLRPVDPDADASQKPPADAPKTAS